MGTCVSRIGVCSVMSVMLFSLMFVLIDEKPDVNTNLCLCCFVFPDLRACPASFPFLSLGSESQWNGITWWSYRVFTLEILASRFCQANVNNLEMETPWGLWLAALRLLLACLIFFHNLQVKRIAEETGLDFIDQINLLQNKYQQVKSFTYGKFNWLNLACFSSNWNEFFQ